MWNAGICGTLVSVPLPKFCEKLILAQNIIEIGRSATELWPKMIFIANLRCSTRYDDVTAVQYKSVLHGCIARMYPCAYE